MKVIQIDCHSMQHEVVADMPFNSAYIDHKGITEDESTYIPYNDSALCEAVQPLMYELAMRNEWALLITIPQRQCLWWAWTDSSHAYSC